MSTEPTPSPSEPAADTAAGDGLVCPSCGTHNPAGMKFCGNCGARLAVGDAPPAPNNGGAGVPGAESAGALPTPAVSGTPIIGGGGGLPSGGQTPASPPARPAISVPTDPIARERERDRLLTLANVQRMRGQLSEARATLDDVIALLKGAPGRDVAPVHELQGDLLAAQENWEGAQKAYGAAHEADPNRASSERKFAQATLRVSDAKAMAEAMASGNLAGLSEGGWNGGQRGKRNPGSALLLSVFIPGLGQFANGQVIKGGMCLALWLLGLIALNLSPEGKAMFSQFLGFVTGQPVRGANNYVSPVFWFLVILVACVWMYSVVDAAVSAARLNEEVEGGDTTSLGGFSRKDWEP